MVQFDGARRPHRFFAQRRTDRDVGLRTVPRQREHRRLVDRVSQRPRVSGEIPCLLHDGVSLVVPGELTGRPPPRGRVGQSGAGNGEGLVSLSARSLCHDAKREGAWRVSFSAVKGGTM
jgi:hypothetical protein